MTDFTLSQVEQIQQWANDNNITLSSIFVPFSVSRNRLEKMKSLNYIVTLQSATGIVSTDYMKGQGHIKYTSSINFKNQSNTKEYTIKMAVNYSCDSGKWDTDYRLKHNVKFPVPTIDEVLYSLNMDSDVGNYSDFEDWAQEFGYDSDSISANDIYRACQKIAKDFNKLLTKQQRKELAELLQDY